MFYWVGVTFLMFKVVIWTGNDEAEFVANPESDEFHSPDVSCYGLLRLF